MKAKINPKVVVSIVYNSDVYGCHGRNDCKCSTANDK